MSDILKRLEDVREDRNPEEDTWDGWQIAEEAIAEIARLRSEVARLRLTDQERKAIDYSIQRIIDHDWHGGDEPEAVVTLCALLKRQGGGE